MKKFIITVLIAILIGYIYGKIVFNQYDKKLEKVFNQTETLYFLQQGVYSNKENVLKYANKINYYLVIKDDDFYRVYVGITKNKNNINKIKEIYTNSGNEIYVREIASSNAGFFEVLNQYDMLLESVEGENQILQIQKQVLSKYEELVINNE